MNFLTARISVAVSKFVFPYLKSREEEKMYKFDFMSHFMYAVRTST